MTRAGLLCTAVLAASTAARAQEADPWWGPDKALHFGVSAALAAGGYGAGTLLYEDTGPRLLLGGGLALAAGIGKELADLTGAGHASWRDLTWNAIGTATGLLFAYAIDRLAQLLVEAPRPEPPPSYPGARWL